MATVVSAPRPHLGGSAAGAALLSLRDVTPGDRVAIQRIDEHEDAGCRYRDLGLYEGAVVTVISAADPVVVCAAQNRIAVCRRCAGNVRVRLLA